MLLLLLLLLRMPRLEGREVGLVEMEGWVDVMILVWEESVMCRGTLNVLAEM
jgi:hypothetical protein